MIAVRLYKLDPKIYHDKTEIKDKPNECQQNNRSRTIEPGTLLLREGEVVQQPDPEFVKPDNPTEVYYRMATEEDAPSQKQMLQYIATPAREPVTSVGPCSGLPPDNKEDMYILRIGKKKAGHVLKTHLEVELRTPKFVSRKKGRFYKDTQYNKKDLEPPPV